jgi:hypothetical protein
VKPVSSSRSPKVRPVRATPSGSRAVRPRHAPSRSLSARCSATRSFRTSTALPGNRSSFLFSRPAALLGSMLYPAQVCSRGWVERALLPPRAHVSLRRLASNPIYFVRADRSPALESYFKGRSAEDLVFGVALDFWALTPICDPHPPACGQRTDPALGFASCRVLGHLSVQPIGLDPGSAHRPPGSHGLRFMQSRAIPIRSWD